MSAAAKQGIYEVGYGKPPVRTQFKKGQSGNPKGFPRGETKLAWALRRLLAMSCEDFDRYKPRTGAEEVARRLIITASSNGPGWLQAVRLICDRTEGKPRRQQPVEMRPQITVQYIDPRADSERC